MKAVRGPETTAGIRLAWCGGSFVVNNIKGKKILNSVVRLYNQDRTHNSIRNHVPDTVHHMKNLKNRKIMEKLLQKKTECCKPISELKLIRKFITGF